jgi:hypothetical protein
VVVVPPGFGAGVPPLWLVVVEIVACVVVWLVVERVGVETDSIDWVVAELLLSSPATMIRPTTSPMTSATRIPIVQRARVFTAAMLGDRSVT